MQNFFQNYGSALLTILDVLGLVIGLAGFGYAIYANRQHARVEAVVKDTLRRLAGEMKVVFSNANWTNQHLRRLGHLLIQPELDMLTIKAEAFDAARDAAACARQLALEYSKIRGIQHSLFQDTEETLPELKSDDVEAAKALHKPKAVEEAKAEIK